MAKYLNPYRALRNEAYRRFWIVQSISLIGTWIDTTLRGWVAVNLFSQDKAAGFVGLIAFLKGFPSVFFSPIAGVLIDWFGPKTILFYSQLIDAVNAFVMAYLVWRGTLSPYHLLVLSLAMGITSGFYLPSRNNFIADIVPKDLLPNALALHSMIFNVARMIGPTIAGFIVRSYGLEVGFIINAISFVPLLVVLPFIQEEDGARNGTPKGLGKFLTDLREGLIFSFKNRTLRRTFLSLTMYSLFGMPFGMLMQVFVKDVVKSDITAYGLIMGMMGVGAFIGANIVSLFQPERIIQAREELLLVAIGTSILLASIFPRYTIVFAFIIGACQSSFFNITNSRTQLKSPQNMRGRTMSVYSFINTGGSPSGTFLLGLTANTIGTRLTYSLAGVVLLFYSIFAFVKFSKK
ncbi:MFS transporter [Fervidobacterium thailandense]|uniref:MFS transporter n=1 Tax=Fervidobacterium thailandense TaxID=1008305 RepID=A0A1E3G3P2_9BACT|nr:MFS transporter [Fervidobacterium thailandense]ODN30308.1 MFS transporter [Fervidobacterium thailandense]